MSDAKTPESAVPDSPLSEEPIVVASDGVIDAPSVADSVSEPVIVDAVPVEPVVAESVVAEPAVAAPVMTAAPELVKKKRGIGAWSFVLGLLTAIADIAFVVLLVVVVVGAGSSIVAGDFSGLTTAINALGLVLLALFLFFGGFLAAGVAAILGLIALVSGRGRILGLFGLIFAAGAIIVRVVLLSIGFSPDLG